MIFQHYFYKDPSQYQESRLKSAMSRWHGGAWETFKSGFQEASEQYTALGWLAEEAKESFVDDQTPISKEEWTPEHYLWRDDVEWSQGLNVGIAEVRAKRSDRLNELQFRRANVDFWSLPNLSGVLLGAMGSPEYVVGWGGLIGRSAKLAQSGVKAGILAKYVKPIGMGMTDNFVADSLYQTTKAMVQLNRGEDPDWGHAALELGMATATGGIIGTFPMAAQVASKVPMAFRPTLVKKAMKDLAAGKPFNFFKRKGMRDTAEEANPEEVIAEIDKRTKEMLDEDARLRQDHSKAAGKDYVKYTTAQARKFIHWTANCLRGKGAPKI